MSDIKSWETPTLVVLLVRKTRLTDSSKDKRPFIIESVIREK